MELNNAQPNSMSEESGARSEEGPQVASSKRKKGDASEGRTLVKVEIEEALASQIAEGMALLKERGVNCNSSDFIEHFLKEATQQDINDWVDLETPMEWRLKSALSDPRKEKLIREIFVIDSHESASVLAQMEKLLFEKSEKSPEGKKPRKKKIEAESNEQEAEPSQMSH